MVTFTTDVDFTNRITNPFAHGWMYPQETIWPHSDSEPEPEEIYAEPHPHRPTSFTNIYPQPEEQREMQNLKQFHMLVSPLNQKDPLIFARSTKALQAITNETKRLTLDSGATHNMSGTREHFEEIYPLLTQYGERPQVTLADANTCNIEGYGYANYNINGIPVRKLELYVPALGSKGHLRSISQHMKHEGCYFLAKNNQAILAFPNAVIDAHTDNHSPCDRPESNI